MPADLIASLSHNAHGIRAVTSRSIALYSTVNEFLIPVFIIDLVRIGVSMQLIMTLSIRGVMIIRFSSH